MKTSRGWQWRSVTITVASFGLGLGAAWLFSDNWQHHIPNHTSRDPAPNNTDSNFSQDKQIERLQDQIEALKEEYKGLQARYEQVTTQTKTEERLALYHALQTILIQLPVVASDLNTGSSIDPKFLAALLNSISRRLEKLEIVQVGQVKEIAAFDPRLHNTSSTENSVEPGQAIRISIPGFRYQDHILARAQVEALGEA